MATPIRLGFVGLSTAGWASRDLAPPLFKSPLSSKYSLVALSTSRAESAEVSAEKYSKLASEAAGTKVEVKPYHGSAEHIARDKDVDMVAVSINVIDQATVASKIIDGGKNLFIEWPAGNRLEDTKALYDAAKAKGIKTAVGLQLRFSHFVPKVKSIIESGGLGKIVSSDFHVFANFGTVFPPIVQYLINPSTGAGPLDIIAGHSFDLFMHVLGPLASFSAVAKNQLPLVSIGDSNWIPTGETVPQGKPTQYCVSGILTSGATFNLHLEAGVSETGFTWVIQGEKGRVRITDVSETEPWKSQPFALPARIYHNGQRVELPAEENRSGLLWEAIADGKEEMYATLEQAVKIKELLREVLRSSEEGRRIDL
ncbi:hypothetical protein D9757_010737 [Collybiopsis confluens]|uniref:Gfo/Idh/MocA-like oxidoreductase N-terminal domain-containing protein n=1 Tax=Collybiopsis confluens TaxID=2823264 RepID=A0A8H5GZP3_9AGAR|nr:hypothetical protein D9757_010737 [Collybiopsis confluens]